MKSTELMGLESCSWAGGTRVRLLRSVRRDQDRIEPLTA